MFVKHLTASYFGLIRAIRKLRKQTIYSASVLKQFSNNSGAILKVRVCVCGEGVLKWWIVLAFSKG